MENMETAANIPESFDYQETDLDRLPSGYRETLKDEIFKGAVTKVERSVGTNRKDPAKATNNLQLTVFMKALNPDGVTAGPETRMWVDIPVANPTVAGHKPFHDSEGRKMLFDKARGFIRAVDGDVLPAFPKKREGTSQYFDPATGENLNAAGQAALVKSIDRMTIEKLQTWYKNPAVLTGATLYFATKKRQNSAYVNVSYVRHDDGGKTVVTENFSG